MKKLLIATACAMAFAGASSAMAETGLFVGAEYGKTKIKTELDVANSNADGSGKEYQYGIRVGSYINDNMRVYANLNQAKDDETIDSVDLKYTNRQLTASVDYMFDLDEVKPFVGATVGTNWAEFEIGSEKDSGYAFAYGLQAGVLVQVGNVDLEAGYRYLKHKNEHEFLNGTIKATAKDTQTPYIAVSYRF